MKKKLTPWENCSSFGLITLLIITFIGILGLNLILSFSGDKFIPNENTTSLTYEKCCDGHFCTDTYYDSEKDLCVLSLCANSLFTNKEPCYYKPK